MNEMLPIDYDADRLDGLKPSCARVDTSTLKGTGFIISANELLTCNHVMDADSATCTFEQAVGVFSAPHRDPDADLCVLTSNDESKAWPPVTIANPAPRLRSWWAFGFPAAFGGQGVPLFGMVADRNCLYHGRRVFQLYAWNLVGDDVQLGGLSGSPVLSGTDVVGVIYRVLAGHGDMQQARMGMVYAVPITTGGNAPPATGPQPPLPPPDPAPSPYEWKQIELFELLSTATSPDMVLSIVKDWDQRSDVAMPADIPLIAAEKLLGMGKPRSALDLLAAIEPSERARQLTALGLSLTGEHDQARAMLKALPLTAETGGISAGVLKRQYFDTGNRAWLQSAFDQYEVAFQQTGDVYPGVNAAATALWLGKRDSSRELAGEVLVNLNRRPRAQWSHWEWASFGEASLLAGDSEKGLEGYGKAVAGAPAMSRDISIMRKQARITLPMLEVPADEFEVMLGIGGVAACTGHRVDETGRKTPRFPRANVPAVARRIRAQLDALNIRYGFSSAAGGADILFIEQLLARGGEPTVYLPFPARDFMETSVGADWRARFESIMRKLGGRCHVLRDHKPVTQQEEDKAYASCNHAIVDAAIEAGRIYYEKPVFIAVIAEERSRKRSVGGAADALQSWREQGLGESIVIDPRRID